MSSIVYSITRHIKAFKIIDIQLCQSGKYRTFYNNIIICQKCLDTIISSSFALAKCRGHRGPYFNSLLLFADFALAKHTPPFEAEPIRAIYNTFSYLEGVIIQGHRNTSMYFYTCLVTSCNRA